MLEIILILLFSESLSATGQILYKKSLNIIETKKYLDFIKTVLRSPKIWLGFFLIGISIFVWLGALAQADLNIVYSLDSLGYIITLVAARIFLGEKIDRHKLIGTLFVVLGILLIAYNY